MQQSNKAHEFDQTREQTKCQKDILSVVWRGGMAEAAVLRRFHNEIAESRAFIDNNTEKQKKDIIFGENRIPYLSFGRKLW